MLKALFFIITFSSYSSDSYVAFSGKVDGNFQRKIILCSETDKKMTCSKRENLNFFRSLKLKKNELNDWALLNEKIINL